MIPIRSEPESRIPFQYGVSPKEWVCELLIEYSFSINFVKPGMGLEGRGRQLSPLPRPAMERLGREAGEIDSSEEPNSLEQLELGGLHLPGSFGVAVLASQLP